jgi:hypothetical protein
MPWIHNAGNEIKEHHEMQIRIFGIFADFVEDSFVGAYVSTVIQKEVCEILNFLLEARLIGSEKEVFFSVASVDVVDKRYADSGKQHDDYKNCPHKFHGVSRIADVHGILKSFTKFFVYYT